jgi:CDP-diacylglycerol--glycerol-3-phosphate 3-phosphatidyltransferase/cardiolipin synthase
MSRVIAGHHRRASAVAGVTAIRVAAAPLFLYTFSNDLTAWTLCLFLFACLTDALDGFLARRLGVSQFLGPYFDATADFLLILAAFSAFAIKGMYPFWTLFLIGAMFLQFILTSGSERPVYDPVGKYYGAFLFAAIAVTLLWPDFAVCHTVLISILGLTVASVASRSVFLRSR